MEDGRSEGRFSRLKTWKLEAPKEDFSGWRLGRKLFQVGSLEDGK